MKYFTESGRLSEAASFFEKLLDKDPEVATVLAKAYIGTDEEIQAVKIMSKALSRKNVSYGVLLVQIDFLRSKVVLNFLNIKKKYDIALKLAKMAVIYAPSEYVTWAKLTEIYTEMNDFESVSLFLIEL